MSASKAANDDPSWPSNPLSNLRFVSFLSTRISYQLSVLNAMAKHATANTDMIVPIDNDTAEQAIAEQLSSLFVGLLSIVDAAAAAACRRCRSCYC